MFHGSRAAGSETISFYHIFIFTRTLLSKNQLLPLVIFQANEYNKNISFFAEGDMGGYIKAEVVAER